ncbi:MAG: hypothetical protein FWF91_01640 [Coriobacteriia bacterium]|nr:hypothetical protein [Coriobacteriia bacterium]
MYKVKCTLKEFILDEEAHPCHFNYKVGDEIYYDGETFTGRICPGLIASMMPIVNGVFLLGHRFTETIAFRYRGADVRDPEMEKYDGVGFRPVEGKGIALNASAKGRARGHHFACADTRILAHFTCVPIDLSDCEYARPFYRRSIAVLEKIEAEPGIRTDELLDRFTEFQRTGIAPKLTPVFVGVLLDALEDMGYIRIEDGQAYPLGKEPPSRPVFAADEE